MLVPQVLRTREIAIGVGVGTGQPSKATSVVDSSAKPLRGPGVLRSRNGCARTKNGRLCRSGPTVCDRHTALTEDPQSVTRCKPRFRYDPPFLRKQRAHEPRQNANRTTRSRQSFTFFGQWNSQTSSLQADFRVRCPVGVSRTAPQSLRSDMTRKPLHARPTNIAKDAIKSPVPTILTYFFIN